MTYLSAEHGVRSVHQVEIFPFPASHHQISAAVSPKLAECSFQSRGTGACDTLSGQVAFSRGRLSSRREHDGPHLGCGLVQDVIDQGIFIVIDHLQLGSCLSKPGLNDVFIGNTLRLTPIA